ncbi:hypothetical protein K7G19_07325 [Cupriavidus sp. DB3]|uniref:hypothetical protein n=1 Tax=Cupriavidus sp. DB3 TaxID=2873259 RepID=UPI001CF5B29C|nr:hypothetical protein [Cupriavidus sp. DB3]MCA7083409.1 hypothetical protein [Cupriavidus sp. DB3]
MADIAQRLEEWVASPITTKADIRGVKSAMQSAARHIRELERRATDGQRDTARGVPRELAKGDPLNPYRTPAQESAYRWGWNGCRALMLAAAPTPPAGDAGRIEGVNKVERDGDFSVRLTFDSCRQASAFDRAAMAAMAASKGEKG